MAYGPPGEIPQGPEGWPRLYEDGNRLTFARPLTVEDAEWWHARFVAPDDLDLHPLAMAQALFAGMPGEPGFEYRSVEPSRDSFELAAEADGRAGSVWHAGVALELRMDRILWDDVGTKQRGLGLGKKMAASLLATADRLKVTRLDITTENVGSYLWAEAGFIPTEIAWRTLLGEIRKRLGMVQGEISQRSRGILQRILYPGSGALQPGDIRLVAQLDDVVSPRAARDPANPTAVRLGKELLVGLNWVGGLDISEGRPGPSERQRLEEWLGI
ncbi:hypothetical protein [Methylobacterium oryzae]|uniref:N-acetyltransferase domain-containing protein n=1 Tax=Methylobacterium oryzae TaxID=334852 RepID=A0ABU7TKS3_9HYPH